MAKITYEDKEFLNKNEEIADNRKVNDSDLNEIKNVVNENDNIVGNLSNLNTNDKSSTVNAINEVSKYGGTFVAEKVLDTDTAIITIDNLDLEKDKNYKILFNAASNADGEIHIKLNNLSGVYQHIVMSAYDNSSSDKDITPRCVWRNAANDIAFNMQSAWSYAESVLKMNLHRGVTDYKTTCYEIDYSIPNPNIHAISFIRGQVNLDTHDNITSITFTNDNGTFRAGSRIIVTKGI